MNETQQNPETQQESSVAGKSTVTRRAILKAGWVAPVVLAVPLMGTGKAGHIPPHGSSYTPGSKDYGSKGWGSNGWGSKDYGNGSKDYGTGSKDYGNGSKDYGRSGKNYGSWGKGGKWWTSWIKWD